MPGFYNSVVYFEKGIDPRGVDPVANQMTTGTLLIGSSLSPYVIASTLTQGDGLTITNGDGSITIGATFASVAETKAGTLSTKVLNPADLIGYMADLNLTGFVSWTGAGNYFDDTTLGSFTVLRGGTGYIKGQLISWTGGQTTAGLTAGNTYYIYMDSTGTIGKTSSRTDQLFLDNIVLFECLRDSTPVTNNQVTVKENHPYDYPAEVSNYEHNNIGTLIENNTNGANIVLNGTQKIQINGADVLSDHGLETTIPDSGGVGVAWIKMYTTAGGKWARQNATDTFGGYYNNAGTPTALGANKFGIYTLYVSKDTLNSTTPTYFAVLDTSQYNNQTLASTAIANGAVAQASNELRQLEICQLGYIIYSQASNSIVQVIIAKSTLRQTISTAGSNAASLINTNTSSFNGWLSASDTNVQASLNTLDDILIGGTSGQIVSSNGAGTKPTYTTATFPKTTGTGEVLLSNSANTVTSGNSLTGDFTYTSSTAGVERILTIANTDNSNTASAATLKITTGGASAGDASVQVSTTTTSWKFGVDNSVTSPTADPFVIAQGTVLGTTNVMSVASSGEINYPLQPSFLAYLSSIQNNKTGNGAVYTIGTDALTEVFDQNSDFNINGTFTAPVTGRYHLNSQIYFVGFSLLCYILVDITTSNRSYNSQRSRLSNSTWGDSVLSSCIADMDAGDTATVACSVTGEVGDTIDISGHATNALTYFSGSLVC